MYCMKCGKPLPMSNLRFCPYCGAENTMDVTSADLINTSVDKAETSNDFGNFQYSGEWRDLATDEERNSIKGSVVFGVVMLAIASLCGFFALKPLHKSQHAHIQEESRIASIEKEEPETNQDISGYDDSYDDSYDQEDRIPEIDSDSEEYQRIEALILGYLDNYLSGELDSLQYFASPVSQEILELSESIALYVSDYDIVSILAQVGANKGEYMAVAIFDLYLNDTDTIVPAYTIFFIRTDDRSDKIYIDGDWLYSSDTNPHYIVNPEYLETYGDYAEAEGSALGEWIYGNQSLIDEIQNVSVQQMNIRQSDATVDSFLNIFFGTGESSEDDSYTPEIDTTNGIVVEYGDTIKIEYVGKIDGYAFDGGSGSMDLLLGSGSTISGFEDGLIGHKTGETVSLDLVFPDSYDGSANVNGKNTPMAGHSVTFDVSILGVYDD